MYLQVYCNSNVHKIILTVNMNSPCTNPSKHLCESLFSYSHLKVGWFSGKPMCRKPKRFLS